MGKSLLLRLFSCKIDTSCTERMIGLKLLEDRIRRDGIVRDGGILKVDSFLNHQMDVAFFTEMAKEFERLYHNCGVNKILTIEASGIGVACITAQVFGCPLVFAKKSKSATVGNDVFTAEVKSFTRNIVSKITVANKYLKPSDTVLIVDDFLAEGNASLGLVDLCKQAGAKVVGVAVAIEKGFQGGRNRLEALGLKVYSAADVKAFVNNKPVF